ncbi:K(+) efflux antiporter 2, chloroplastic [Beta vulgaris subsp. vulgaris]|uniref:K(+) efflux antiporter 2, chloroplastic n=1 Tax=Beta vulgaris subsp. vulgaris TaxID=3555 RepID=UPI00203762C1|nr:K(+) efflux antiporter 2, chloroplastic [Beta vulgaris subsp. vulgaris]
MDTAYSFKQSNLIYGIDCKRYRSSDFVHSKLGFRISGFEYNYGSNLRSVSRICYKKNVKRIDGYSGGSSAKLPFGRDIDGHLWGLPLRKAVVGGCKKDFSESRSLGGVARCQGNDAVVYIDGNGRSVELGKGSGEEGLVEEDSVALELDTSGGEKDGKEDEEVQDPTLDELRESYQKACRELEVARLNSTMFEEKAQKISEAAFALKDQAENARNDVDNTLKLIDDLVDHEVSAKEAVQKATMALSLAEARLQVALESVEAVKATSDSESENEDVLVNLLKQEEESLLVTQQEIRECKLALENCEAEFTGLQVKKEELQKEVDRLNELADQAQMSALKAEEDVANIMLLAEQAVAFELQAAERVNDAEMALQRAEKLFSSSQTDITDPTDHPSKSSSNEDGATQEEFSSQGALGANGFENERNLGVEGASLASNPSLDKSSDKSRQNLNDVLLSDDLSDKENKKLLVEVNKDADLDIEKVKGATQTKKAEIQKEVVRESSPQNSPKASVKKSSRFFPASFFSFDVDGEEFTPASIFHGAMDSAKKQMPKLIVGLLLIGTGVTYYINQGKRGPQLLQRQDVITTSIEEVSFNGKPIIQQMQKIPKTLKRLIDKLPQQEITEEEASLFDMVWLLLASVIFVPIFQKIPGGSPVLGYLAAGILIGPYGLSIIRYVHGTKAIAEFGVVFLLFNIGLELSVERLSSMKKYVFGLGSAQVLITAAAVGMVAHFVSKQAGPAAIVIGNGLALSSTAVVLQVLQERGESTSRHGRATFSVLLFQDLAVVVLLILIPLISPNSSKGGIGFQAIAEALGLAAVKAIVAIAAIIAGGRLLLRPIYKQIAENQNAEIFSANTLLVILGTSLLTARAGLSMALGAFLAGLLLAETEFSLQVESDIAPYRGLLLGLFFMTVGMSIDPKLLISNFPVVMGALGLLIVGKTLLVTLVGRLFGVSTVAAIRSGLLLAPGGEFAFVAFGEAVNQGIMSPELSSLMFLIVGISMALTPWLAAGGQLIASRFELHDVRSLLPVESETDDLQDHIIICGFGRVGQIIAQLLSERLIPFVALDVRSDRVAVGRALDLPVYFGDAGSREVLHKVGAERACAAAITLDTPGANYRTVWALSKHFPNVKTFVRAHDVDHGLNLEKAGATAVVPETLEPSLQLAAAVLAQAKLPTTEIASAINEFRSRHLAELTELSEASGSSLGYGYSRVTSKSKSQPLDSPDGNQISEGTLAS